MISIIVPTLNEEKYIAATLESLKSLSLPHEIIVSDGGSTDKTLEIARKYTDKIVPAEGEGYRTISKNRNAGARKSQGEFLVFVDSAVTIPNVNAFFARALADFEKMPELLGLSGFIKVEPSVATFMDKIVHQIMTMNFIILNNALHRGAAAGKFQMIRREAFFRLGGFREDLPTAEDLDMFARLSKIGRTYIDRQLVVYHPGRRAHAIGWPRLLWRWTLDATSFIFTSKSYSKDWKQIK